MNIFQMDTFATLDIVFCTRCSLINYMHYAQDNEMTHNTFLCPVYSYTKTYPLFNITLSRCKWKTKMGNFDNVWWFDIVLYSATCRINRYLKHHKILTKSWIWTNQYLELHDNHKYSLHFAFLICASRGGDIPKMYGDITRWSLRWNSCRA